MRVISDVSKLQIIAAGRSVRARHMLRRRFGSGRWRKMKGIATVELVDGRIGTAELHRYEAHRIGRVMFKLKRVIGES